MIPTTANKRTSLYVHPYEPIELDFGSLLRPMTDDEFLEFSLRHRDLRIEMDKDGEIIVMPGTGGLTGNRNARIIARAVQWAEEDGTGIAFDSDTIFRLPNGAKRLPDFSWMKLNKWNSLTREQQEKIIPFAPDFVIELRSPSDPMAELQAKMNEYIENGTSLGWLIDPIERKVHVYRRDNDVEVLNNPSDVSGNPVLKGFSLKLNEIWS